jgi:hypothetical protein
MLIFYFIYKIASKQEAKQEVKAQKKVKQEKATLGSLPDIHIVAKEMTEAEKALNLYPAAKELLQSFDYTRSGRIVTVRMKNGDTLKGEISKLEVWFEKWGKENHIVKVSNGSKLITFYTMSFLFTDSQWEVILHMLSLAGKAHNIIAIEPTSKLEKNLNRANTVLKIIRLIS